MPTPSATAPINFKNLDREGLYSLFDKYQKNENENSHAENTLLLAEHFGTYEDRLIAQANIDLIAKLRYASPQLRPIVYEIQSKTWKRALALADHFGITR